MAFIGVTLLAAAAEPARFAYHLPPDIYRKAVEYAHTRYLLHFLAVAWGLLVLTAIIRLQIAQRLRRRAEALSPRLWLQAIVFTPPLLFLLAVLDLPLDLYRHHLALHYRQSIEGWLPWFADWAKAQLISLIAGTFVIWLLYAVIRRAPRRWWLWFWIGTLPLIAFGVFIAPLVVDPLFHRFRPLHQQHPDLVRKLHQLTARAGEPIPSSRMFEMLASEKTNELNAYVTGFGASKRVVIFDTILANESTDQVLSTFGHELGHYVLGHVWKSMLAAAAFSLLLLYLGARLVRRLIPPAGRWGIRGLADWASLPVLLLLLSIASFVSEPLGNAYSRWQEAAADRYSLWVNTGVVPDPGAAAAQSFQIEGELNLADPAPPAFIRFWLYSHPPIASRIRMASEYRPGPGT